MFNATASSNENAALQPEDQPNATQQTNATHQPNTTHDPDGAMGDDGRSSSIDQSIDQLADLSTIIQQVASGAILADALPIELRRQCVSFLTLEGMSANDIVQVMKISPRTVRRDRASIRQTEAIMPDAHLGDELLGEYQRFLHAGIQRLTRRANDQSEPAYVRLWAEEAITRMYQRFIETARKMNYFRDGTSRLRHQIATDPAEQKREVERYEAGLKLAAAKDPLPTMQLQKGVLEMLKNLGIGKQKEREAANASKASDATKASNPSHT